MKLILSLFFLFSFSVAFAKQISINVIGPVKGAHDSLGVGSKVELTFLDSNEKKEYLFMGRMMNHPHLGEEILFLDESDSRILMINSDSIKNLAKLNPQIIVSPLEQAGETCAAYALFHFWQQTSAAGFSGNRELSLVMSSERSRLKFFEETMTRYYLGRTSTFKPIMKSFGERFGFKCKQKIFTDSLKASEYVFNQILTGMPVIMEFFLGSNMVTSNYEVEDYESKLEMDTRLWTPRKVGDRNGGGHAIVAAAGFISKGRKLVLVLDSNWTEPRVWDLEKYLGEKTAINEMIFHSCY